MSPAVAPLPSDLWPQAYPAKSSRTRCHMLTLEIPGLTEALLLSVLARAIHLEMRAVGEWTARIETSVDKDFPSAREFACLRADNAARLLALYVAVFAAAQYVSASDIAPEALKSAASQSYQFALRDESAKHQVPSSTVKDALYQTEKTTAVAPSSIRRCSPTKS